MFKINKYSQCYYSIIDRAKTRVTEGYTEIHHILPKSMGGTNDVSNLVKLTAREHFICHLLLPKMTDGEDKHKMIYAYSIMSGRKIYGARKYSFYKEEYSIINSLARSGSGNGMYGVDRKGEKNTFFGMKHSDETKRKISEGQKRRKHDRPDSFKSYERTEEHRKTAGATAKSRSTCYTFKHINHGEFYGTTGDLGRAFNFRGCEAYKLVKGEYKTYKGWIVLL
jgi:hypothetical protein